jgi:class 3 adenylate cyclase/tetratricopeptide (TPR) repeat protein
VRCPTCGVEVPADKRFCADCGTRLPQGGSQPADPTTEEIRTVTVLFADVAGSTAMSAQLGPEAVKAVMDRVFERLHEVILSHGGTVDKYIGDCVMALFGAPLAFGDDPARAVRAALAIQRALVELRVELEAQKLPGVQMRIGINTGAVIAGRMGAGADRRYTVLGHPVNVAAHLQQVAPVGGVLVGTETWRRVRGLFYVREHLTPHGQAFQVIAERSGGLWLRPREILGREIDSVGRALELETLVRMVRECRTAREAHLVLVAGEPGIGKSRLLFDLLARLDQDEPEVERIVGFAHPLSSGVPFSVTAEAIRRVLRIAPDDPPLAVATKIRSLLVSSGRASVDADHVVLQRILGLDQGEELAPEGPSLVLRRVLDLLSDVVDWFTDQRPVLLVIEDLHWCDASSLTLLDHLHRRLAHKPLLLLGLTRPEFLKEHPEMMEGPRRRRIDLGPLDRAALSQLLDSAVGSDTGQKLLEFVSGRTLGNPYYVEEILRTLEERRVLVRRIGGWDLMDTPSQLEIPPGVEALTQARIDNLTRSQRRLLCAGAVAGGTFWDGLLKVLCEGFSPIDLSVLVRRELVVPRQESSFRDQVEYTIVHDLTREVAYRMLPEQQRVKLHRRVAAWIIDQGATSPEDLALVGRHLDLGGQPEEAAVHLARAGDVAFAAAAYPLAARHYTRAIELTTRPRRLFDLFARRERVLNTLGRWAEQRRDAESMLALAVELGNKEYRVEALLRMGRARLNVGELDEARAAFEEAHGLAVDQGDADAEARSLRWLGMVHFNRAEHLRARALFEEALQVAEKNELETLAAELAYELGVTEGTIGDYSRALDVSYRALEMFRRQGNRYQEAFCLGNSGCFHVYLGEYAEARQVLEEAVALGHAMGLPLAEASAKANLGNALRLLKRPEEALQLEEEAHQVAEEIGDPRLAADALVYGALAALDAGQVERAEAMARRAVDVAQQGDISGTEAMSLMALSRVTAASGRLGEALTAAEGAVAILDRIGSVEGFEHEILLLHADLCQRLDRPVEAEQSLRRARQEIGRKASYIRSSERRRRFLSQAGVEVEPADLVEGSHGP